MRRTILVLLLCAGCAPRATTTTTTVASSVTGVQVTSVGAGSLAAFVAAVPPFEEGGECRRLEEGRRVLLQFRGPGQSSRSVSVEVDPQGKVLSYSDVRGDVQINGTGPRTAIMVKLDTDVVLAMNERVAEPGTAMGRAAEAMELENLGNPRRMIELVRRRCMGGQG
ncbi:MAG: hypothetical protein ACJ8GN_06110 [Longimicrobiaceae bacterium]